MVLCHGWYDCVVRGHSKQAPGNSRRKASPNFWSAATGVMFGRVSQSVLTRAQQNHIQSDYTCISMSHSYSSYFTYNTLCKGCSPFGITYRSILKRASHPIQYQTIISSCSELLLSRTPDAFRSLWTPEMQNWYHNPRIDLIYACSIVFRFSDTLKGASVLLLTSSTVTPSATSIRVSPSSQSTSNTA